MLQERSSGSVKIIWLDRSEVLARLRAIAHRIGEEHSEVCQVRLFGSLARGDQVGTSDADVLIVLHGDTEENLLERIQRFYSYFDLPVGVDVLAYTEAEVTRRLASKDHFMTRAWHESKLLWSAPDR